MRPVKYQEEDEDYPYDEHPDMVKRLLEASSASGRSMFSLIWEWWPLYRGVGKLRLDEYITYGLHLEGHTHDTRRRFLSDHAHWDLALAVADPSWRAVSEDKWLMYTVLGEHGLHTPRTLAVVDPSERRYGRYPTVNTADGLREILEAHLPSPLFLKPVLGIKSLGVMRITGIEDGVVQRTSARPLPLEELFELVCRRGAYLVQHAEVNHPDVARYTEHLATLRFNNFLDAEGFRAATAIFKIPGPGSIADNYWRKGNMLADLDPQTGSLRRVIRGSAFERVTLDTLPGIDTPIADVVLPFWEEAKALNETCARLFAPVAYSSTDLALTPDGPMVVEVNMGAGFSLPQAASGRGFLTDENEAFFRRNGAEF